MLLEIVRDTLHDIKIDYVQVFSPISYELF